MTAPSTFHSIPIQVPFVQFLKLPHHFFLVNREENDRIELLMAELFHSFEGQNLIVYRSLQTSSCHLSFHCTPYAITRRLTMACSEERPQSFIPKVVIVPAEVHEIFIIFVLTSTTITPVLKTFDLRQMFHYVLTY